MAWSLWWPALIQEPPPRITPMEQGALNALSTYKITRVLGAPCREPGQRPVHIFSIISHTSFLCHGAVVYALGCLGTCLISTHQMPVVFCQPKMYLVIIKCPQRYTIPPAHPYLPSHWETLIYPLATSLGGTSVDQPLEIDTSDCVAP